jgi:serine/threonine protein kinase
MGEVYLGLQEGAGGLERFVVIKRIDPEYVKDENFTSMLLEEARLSASIRHPNVVQILDIGHSVDGYFIVMEYLSGETLLYLTRTLHARGERMPPSIACRIVAEIAAGLHCAHTATDPDGDPQPIVHRDVTPSNLIVCFNGVVKIVDFGVAKVTLLDGDTRGGAKVNVKGKMSYLAPEQLYDKPVDGRADVFQLGICLHEFLTGTRLFRAETDEKRVLAVLKQPIPAPSEIVPSLPRQLDDVVLWALERDPEQRPETADEFRRALELAMEDVGSVSGADLGGWMRSAFAERLRERSRFERQCVAEMRAGRTLSGEMPAARAASGSDVDTGDRSGSGRFGVTTSGFSLPDSASFARTTGSFAVVALSPPPGETQSMPVERSQSQHSRSQSGTSWVRWVSGFGGTWSFVGLAVLVVVAAYGIASGINARRRSAAPPAQSQGAVLPAAEVAAPAARPATSPAGAAGPAQAPGAPRQPARTFEVAISVEPAGATVELDGVDVARGSYRTTLPVDGTRHVMRVHADGYGSVALDFIDQPPPSRIRLEPALAGPVQRKGAAQAARPVRRAPTAEAGRKRSARQREREKEDSGDEVRDDGAMSDNPDPWAADADVRESDTRAEGSE